MDYRLTDLYQEAQKDEWSDELSPLYEDLKRQANRYEDAKPLAHGGMKRISRVFDRHTNRFVAMAQLRDDVPDELFEPFPTMIVHTSPCR
jgi:hypothetical protein